MVESTPAKENTLYMRLKLCIATLRSLMKGKCIDLTQSKGYFGLWKVPGLITATGLIILAVSAIRRFTNSDKK